jgi:cytochrome c oxidase assembly factor CtaG/polyferredoxin
MSPTLDAFLRSWPFDPWLIGGLALTAIIYWRGWRVLKARNRERFNPGHLAAFLGGLSAIFLALSSPIEPFAGLLLQVHMAQHLLLMMIAPPLLWLGNPFFPLLRGMPIAIRIYWLTPLVQSLWVRRVFSFLTHPFVALPVYVATTWLWHVPSIYNLAMRSNTWHYVQHLCFLGSALLFWYPVVRPYPSRPRWSLWLLIPFLLLADLQNTILSAFLTFSDKVLYAYYAEVPRLDGLSALDDQSASGVLMWVPGSVAFLLPLFWIGVRLLYGSTDNEHKRWETGRQRIALPLVTMTGPSLATSPWRQSRSPASAHSIDLLAIPLLGWFLKRRHARLALQLPMLLLSGVVIHDGLKGPPVGAINLAGVLPWIHWRGFVILGLLAAGNVFCMACPFTLPRTLARGWLPRQWRWPRPLRSKWLAVGLLVLFLWAYEALALWDSPWWTAWIAVGYFLTAFAIDSLFQGAAFCKYVCPIGQFNFVQSLVSPFEVKVRETDVCLTCRTKDCIRGREAIPGCEMDLFQPRKVGNMDCTFCLDCIHACPHDNIGILSRTPGSELWLDSFRSGLGRFSKRPDIAALVLVLVFGAFVNAAGMVSPVVEWQEQMALQLGLHSPLLATTLFYLATLVLAPVAAMSVISTLSKHFSRSPSSVRENATRYLYALVPLGFSMWLAHYSFHFLSSFEVVIPATQRFLADHGYAYFGPPEYVMACCRSPGEWLTHLQIVFLDLGMLLSLYVGYRFAISQNTTLRKSLEALAPWALLIVILFATGIWIVLQPMQMRGTLMGAG